MERSQNNKILRKQHKSIRDSIAPFDRQFLSQQIVISLKALLESDFERANIFLCFYPFGSEVDVLLLYKHLLEKGKELYFPVSDKGNHQLIFRRVSNLSSDFHLGAYDIMEPNDDLPVYNNDSDAVVFTPGLVFDTNLNRLGYGAGYYDRFFHQHSDVIKIGLCFNSQINNEIIPEEHDVPMDIIVTDRRILRRKGYDIN
ncbi:MAG: 5-formyltetrahydrofolate cyclo-ligase [Pseudobutyrivibrio sp.]|nr:5-formyltetrahydrofolate cyclo-ligase [Pseudobutyrivibrio sp.]